LYLLFNFGKIMLKNTLFILLFALLCTTCFSEKKTITTSDAKIKIDSLYLFDQTRRRAVPVALYFPERAKNEQKLVIFSHGYGQNKGGDNVAYSYLTEYLATKGYFVASIQHELPTDDLLPLTGKAQIVRRPFWERGADNILFVINELRKLKPNLDFKDITLIGHSNGGDMTALFPQKYPNVVTRIVTLDHRRMALPRAKMPKILSLRSSDQAADEGVLPSETEQKTFDIKIIKLPNTIHDDMDDHANEVQRKEINSYILGFLKEKI
jgi:predicted peptidase